MLLATGGLGCQQGFTPLSVPAEQATPALNKQMVHGAADEPTQQPRSDASALLSAHDASGASQAGGVQGHLLVAPHVAAHVRAGETIFVMARLAQSGEIMAVTRLTAAEPLAWPMVFHLEAEHLTPEMQLLLSARVDKDGDASSKNPGDVVGEGDAPVRVPTYGVNLTLQHLLE